MWYKNIAGRFFGLVTEHGVKDRRTDRITTPKTVLAQLRCAITMTENVWNVNESYLS